MDGCKHCGKPSSTLRIVHYGPVSYWACETCVPLGADSDNIATCNREETHGRRSSTSTSSNANENSGSD